jgi:hypothetical protein
MIFPGMDPYLEDPRLWPGVHNSLVVRIHDQLQPLLRPRYVAALEERVYLEGPSHEVVPDVWVRRAGRPGPEPVASGGRGAATAVLEDDSPIVVTIPSLEVHESIIEILDLRSGQRVVTVIEVLSPSNKYAGVGKVAYLRKQREVLASDAHLVEIDLLRSGPHALAVPAELIQGQIDYDYMICVNRAVGSRGSYELYPRELRARLPRIKIPLAGDDPDVLLDLQAALDRTHEAGFYEERIDYDRPCVPPLPAEDQAWADRLISGKRDA